ncbi:MAG: hypothetical protein D084_Lepto4C00486G0001 [Leptospirillum sp. Group IV 'UBA BS']|nr:MAG: hypothetical protein D084_Lepto4C00486G0001 [Leptospirillum sp. Group IV 'UBA BS']
MRRSSKPAHGIGPAHNQISATTAVEQVVGDFTVDDLLCQAFDNGCFPDAGLADQNRIVFCSTSENLKNTLDLVVSADHGIQPSIGRHLGQVTAKFVQGRRVALPLLLPGRSGSRFFEKTCGQLPSGKKV